MEKRKLPRCKDAKTPTKKTKKPCGEDQGRWASLGRQDLGPEAQEETKGTSGGTWCGMSAEGGEQPEGQASIAGGQEGRPCLCRGNGTSRGYSLRG